MIFLTDNEIIQALECCRDDERYDTCEYCLKCPVSNYNLNEETEAVNCVDALLTRAIDLIKRKDAEIERLTRERDFYKAPSSELARGCEQIKTEAIKEFAERLKNKSEDCTGRGKPYVTFEDIDDLVKEMTE